jgi:Lactonase, 7-bladed beta-propeller
MEYCIYLREHIMPLFKTYYMVIILTLTIVGCTKGGGDASSPTTPVVSTDSLPPVATNPPNPPVPPKPPVPANPKFAYVTNLGGNSVTVCKVETSTGRLTDCRDSGGNGFRQPSAIAINNRLAYVTNTGGDAVTICTIDTSTGGLTRCQVSTAEFTKPEGIAINNRLAYVTNNTTVRVCAIATNGELSCRDSGGKGFSIPFGIAINNKHAYVTNFHGGTVTVCTINATDTTGGLTDCQDSGGEGLSNLNGIAFYNGRAYVINYLSGQVSVCTVVDASTGKLSCRLTDVNYDDNNDNDKRFRPFGIAINNGHAYVTNYDYNKVRVCAIATNGELSCRDSGGGKGFSQPSGIAFYTP